MDYRGFAPGRAPSYFPVFVAGRAASSSATATRCQGDGEIVGTGIEISLRVEFTVDAASRASEIGWPRGENADYIFTVGNARPLDQALQHATTEMLRWLDGGLRPRRTAASHLLGQVVRYDLGNVFDPAYTMVAQDREALPAGAGRVIGAVVRRREVARLPVDEAREVGREQREGGQHLDHRRAPGTARVAKMSPGGEITAVQTA